MLNQNELFRQHAFGSFRGLTQEILMDPAMLLYLDTGSSRKGHPNENFAREVMELFTLGEGNYTEADAPDAEDVYGRSKSLGEASGAGSLTVRTSIIGRELASSHGLIDWFLSQEGKTIRGYQKAIFSGFTTLALARIIGDIIEKHPHLDSLYQVSAAPISKFDLLQLVKHIYGCKIQIEPDAAFLCDRSLNSDRFRTATGFLPPSWPEMIREMHQDPTPYQEIRRNYAHR